MPGARNNSQNHFPNVYNKCYPVRIIKIAYVGKDYTLRQLRSSQHRKRNQSHDRGGGFGYIELVEGMG